MSSIEEKLRTLREIIAHLQEFERHLHEDQMSITSQLKESKSNWNDPQIERFNASYVINFLNSLGTIQSLVKKSISFLENKYSTLETHRN